jgi:hypothetical protein
MPTVRGGAEGVPVIYTHGDETDRKRRAALALLAALPAETLEAFAVVAETAWVLTVSQGGGDAAELSAHATVEELSREVRGLKK